MFTCVFWMANRGFAQVPKGELHFGKVAVLCLLSTATSYQPGDRGFQLYSGRASANVQLDLRKGEATGDAEAGKYLTEKSWTVA